MHWNGSNWTVVPTPKLAGDIYLNDVAAVSPTDVWAVGYSVPANLDIQPHFLHWNGAAWSVIPSPHLTSTYNYLQGITAISANRVWAVGSRTVSGDQDVSFVERWDGAQWRIEPTPNRANGGNYLYDVTVDPTGGLWSVGYFYPDGSSDLRTLIQHRRAVF